MRAIAVFILIAVARTAIGILAADQALPAASIPRE